MPVEEKTAFQIRVPARAATPESAALAGGEGEVQTLDQMSVDEVDAARNDSTWSNKTLCNQ